MKMLKFGRQYFGKSWNLNHRKAGGVWYYRGKAPRTRWRQAERSSLPSMPTHVHRIIVMYCMPAYIHRIFVGYLYRYCTVQHKSSINLKPRSEFKNMAKPIDKIATIFINAEQQLARRCHTQSGQPELKKKSKTTPFSKTRTVTIFCPAITRPTNQNWVWSTNKPEWPIAMEK